MTYIVRFQMNCKGNNNNACDEKYDFYDINIKHILMFQLKSRFIILSEILKMIFEMQQIFEIISYLIYMPQSLFFLRNHDLS